MLINQNPLAKVAAYDQASVQSPHNRRCVADVSRSCDNDFWYHPCAHWGDPMPLMLLKFLPIAGKYLGIALIAFFAYRHIVKSVETRMELERQVQAAMLEKLQDDIEAAISKEVSAIDQRTGETIRQIETVNRTIVQPTIEREIKSEVRLSDSDAGLTDGLLDALNISRKLSHTSGPARSVDITLPAPAPADR